MKNRFSTLSKSAKFMLVLLAAYGVTSSCKDEYRLDDEKPSWLNSSVYESLASKGTYINYLRLIGDRDVNAENARPISEVLSKTGSNTVFAANDKAWEEFFAHNATLPETNPWHNATSYEKLSRSQKLLLMNTSMLDHAVVMENLSSEEIKGSMVRGRIMRRFTRAHTTDSITWLPADQLPINYSVGNGETDLWARFRTENGGKGVYLVMDSVPSMMLHFTNEFLKNNNITDQDFKIFTGKERNTEDVHIYDALLTEKDGVCQNGYVNNTEKVIIPLPNMAEALRMDPETKIFSHMLDRWSAPFPNMGVTRAYRDIMNSRNLPWSDEDTIFTKRYFSASSYPGGRTDYTPLTTRPDGQRFRDAHSDQVSLKFDPGWNGFFETQSDPGYDMASMYVPNDQTLREYFYEGGGGWNLIQTFYTKAGTEDAIPYVKPTNDEELFRQIDQIPISTLNSLINNIMFKSFVGSVPSKMNSLRDDANEQLFTLGDSEKPGDEKHLMRSILTSNGVIYITDKVYGPADYTSVAAPAYISLTNTIMRWAIYNGYFPGTEDFMELNYYAYLKAMQSRFAMFIPNDEGMKYYYDPTSFGITISNTSSPRLIRMTYNKTKEKGQAVENTAYAYNPKTGTVGKALSTTWKLSDGKASDTKNPGELVNRLKDILESHTLVLEGNLADSKDYIESDIDNFYLSKNGAPIKVTREGNHIVKVQGGFQIDNENDGIIGDISPDNKGIYTELHGIQTNEVVDYTLKNNGITYILDSPIIPTSRSVYAYIDNERTPEEGEVLHDEYSAFSKLCAMNDDTEAIICACGLVTEDPKTTDTQAQKRYVREMQKYYTFKDLKGIDYNVVFFNNYNYSVFVPTNQAVDDAIANGLPTWESIIEDYESLKDEETGAYELTLDDSLRLQAKIICLTNFIRYHFADNSIFVDNSNIDEKEFVTSSYDRKVGLFSKILVKRQGGKLMVKDVNGGDWATIEGKYNVLARDIICNKKPEKKTMSGVAIQSTSFAVIHQIPTSLNHIEGGGRYDDLWKTSSDARRYIQRYAIPALNN